MPAAAFLSYAREREVIFVEFDLADSQLATSKNGQNTAVNSNTQSEHEVNNTMASYSGSITILVLMTLAGWADTYPRIGP